MFLNQTLKVLRANTNTDHQTITSNFVIDTLTQLSVEASERCVHYKGTCEGSVFRVARSCWQSSLRRSHTTRQMKEKTWSSCQSYREAIRRWKLDHYFEYTDKPYENENLIIIPIRWGRGLTTTWRWTSKLEKTLVHVCQCVIGRRWYDWLSWNLKKKRTRKA